MHIKCCWLSGLAAIGGTLTVSSMFKPFIPPGLISLGRKFWQGKNIQFSGDYPSWQSALDAAGGYDTPAILERVREAALKVKRGEAVFERDSVCFDHEEYRWPTLACLLRIAAENGGKLRVLDFGGSLGSSYFQHRKHFRELDFGGSLGCFYFQHRKFFNALKEIRWAVVEQSHFVACGKSEFQSEYLYFYDSIKECIADGSVDVIFCSSVLQYLERPYSILDSLAETGAEYIIIDRTGFVRSPRDILSVQYASFGEYKRNLPAWFLAKGDVIRRLSNKGYELEVEFPCQESADIKDSEFVGMAFKLRGIRK